MIEDVIELVFAHDIVRAVVVDSDGCDEYLHERASDPGGSPIRVRVRPDGKFSRAVSTEGYLSLGQVWTLCDLGSAAASSGLAGRSRRKPRRPTPQAAHGQGG